MATKTDTAPSGQPWAHGVRTCDKDGRAYGGFQWKVEAGDRNEAPDWSPVAECGKGLHLNPEGLGDWSLLSECPVTIIAPFSERLPMHRACYDPSRSTAAFYAWFIWLKPCMRPRRFMVRMPRREGGFDWRPGVMPIEPGTKKRLFRRSDLRLAMGGEALAALADLKAAGVRT